MVVNTLLIFKYANCDFDFLPHNFLYLANHATIVSGATKILLFFINSGGASYYYSATSTVIVELALVSAYI